MDNLTHKQAEFVKEYIETGNGTQSALAAYDITTEGKTKEQIEKTASVIASENLGKLRIQKYLESIADKAATRIEQLMEQSENLPVALSASKDIMDRAGFKPVDKSEAEIKGQPFNLILRNIDGSSYGTKE